MKIVFFGTSPFGLPALEALLKAGHTLEAVVTTADKPQGRHLKISPSPVKEWALAHKIVPLESSRKNSLSLKEPLQKMDADVFVVISFGVILPEALLNIPKTAALNVHSSLLPKYRGPAPIHWAILNGDTETGVTVMRMAPTLDTGDILLQKKTEILPQENEPILHDRLAVLGAQTLLEALQFLESGDAHFVPQEEALATYARKITKDDGRIRWNEPVKLIHDRVRALSGWPGAFTFLKEKRILIHQTTIAAKKKSSGLAGQVLTASKDGGILVAAGNGILRVEVLQLEGKKQLSAAQFLQGSALKVGDILE